MLLALLPPFMADHLDTPLVHRFVTSPAGALLDAAPYEALKTRSLPLELGVARARAAAELTLGSGPEAFLREVGAPPAPYLHDEVERALAAYAPVRAEYDDVTDRWDAVYWGDETASEDERVALERQRRSVSTRRARPTRIFRRVVRKHLVPSVKYDLPDPEDAVARWHHELESPADLYALGGDLPTVERSESVPGPGTREYRVRFESPSAHVGEPATARVYEPATPVESAPTLIYHSGFGSMGDLLTYWPEEEYVARALAPLGYRVILPDAPWHGRREPAGHYSGEPYLAGAPVSMFQLFSAAARETGVLVDWARRQGALSVGVGGVSLGGLTTAHVVGWCDDWPASTRPDLAFPVAASGDVAKLLFASELTSLLELDDALAAAEWTPAAVETFAPVLDPPADPGIDPSRIYSFGGLRDDISPYRGMRNLLNRWGVPASNRREWYAGHFGVLMKLIRETTFQNAVRSHLGESIGTPSVAEQSV
jgi:hypothetical protein